MDDGGTDREEVARLRAEVAALRTQVDRRRQRQRTIVGIRGVVAAVLVAVAAFALVTSVVGVWAARTAFDTDRWVAAVAPLPRDPLVATAVAQYATTELFEVLDVDQRLRDVLPEQAAFVVAPLTGQLRGYIQNTVDNVLQSERFEAIWVELNRRAHQRAIEIISGESSVVVARQDRVVIDLLPLINQVLRQLSAQLPTMFGRQLALPNLSSGEIPANLRERVSAELGVPLPANFAQFTVYNAGQLEAVRQAVVTAKRGIILFVAGTILLLGLALLISPRRRRTLLQLGLWLVIAAVAITASLRAARNEVVQQVPTGAYRDGVGAAFTTVFASLRDRGVLVIWIGVALAVLAYLVGPGRLPTWLRHQTARGARAGGRWAGRGFGAGAAQGPQWIAAHLDAVRIGGVVVAAVFALLLTSWTSLLVIALVLAAFEVAVTVIARSAAERAGEPADTIGPPVEPT
jgi:hypothetical protein